MIFCYIKRYKGKLFARKNILQRNKMHKAYLIILHNKIYRNRCFGSKNPSSGIERTKPLKAIYIFKIYI